MREIHFFEDEMDEYEWVLLHEIDGSIMQVANDFARMKYVAGHLSEAHVDIIITTQMCYLETRWLEEGFRIIVHDHTGTFEITLGDGNERTDRYIRYGHNLFKLWIGGEFGLKEAKE